MKRHTHAVGCLLMLLTILPLVFIVGCKKKDASESQQAVTIDNLQTAYSAETKRAAWYDQFAKQATKERLANLATLFRAISRSEQIQAGVHAGILKSKGFEPKAPQIDSLASGNATQYLKGAVSLETQEFESMYPALVRAAEMEKFADVAEQFKLAQKVDARHYELIKDIFDSGGKVPKVNYSVCTVCGNIISAEKTEECPVCKSKKDKFEKI